MKFHPLPPDLKCPVCNAGLAFVRVTGPADLYECTGTPECQTLVLHYQQSPTSRCGWARFLPSALMGEWTFQRVYQPIEEHTRSIGWIIPHGGPPSSAQRHTPCENRGNAIPEGRYCAKRQR